MPDHLPTYPTRIEGVLVEGPVPAWEGCLRCFGTGELPSDQGNYECEKCKGDGGHWHEAVIINPVDKGPQLTYQETVTKSSMLMRKWEICPRCGNANHEDSCPDCLNDAGRSTGAVPGTAGPWELVK